MARRITTQEQKNRVWFKAEVGNRLEALGAVRRGEEKCYPYLLATSMAPWRLPPKRIGWLAFGPTWTVPTEPSAIPG